MRTYMARASSLREQAGRIESRCPDWRDVPFLRERLRRMYERAWLLEDLAEQEAARA